MSHSKRAASTVNTRTVRADLWVSAACDVLQPYLPDANADKVSIEEVCIDVDRGPTEKKRQAVGKSGEFLQGDEGACRSRASIDG